MRRRGVADGGGVGGADGFVQRERDGVGGDGDMCDSGCSRCAGVCVGDGDGERPPRRDRAGVERLVVGERDLVAVSGSRCEPRRRGLVMAGDHHGVVVGDGGVFGGDGDRDGVRAPDEIDLMSWRRAGVVWRDRHDRALVGGSRGDGGACDEARNVGCVAERGRRESCVGVDIAQDETVE